MYVDFLIKNKLPITIGATLLIGINLLWDYNHGGVPTHYILHNKDLPGFSNWLGLITIPVLTWIAITLSQRRIQSNSQDRSKSHSVSFGFLGSLLLGIGMSLLWEIGFDSILPYLLFLPLLLALFIPVHYPEHFLGLILGMAYTFGGVLPIIFGFIIGILCFLVHKVLRNGILYFIK